MATDFGYNNKTIVAGGPIKPNGKDMPIDSRTRVETYADIQSIPNPYVGMVITVLQDENNGNVMKDYKVKSLKANSLGVANTVIDEIVPYADYLGVSGASGEGLTTEQAQHLQTAYLHSQSTHVQASDIPSLNGYATETFVTNKIAEASLSGGEVDLSGYATKDDLNSKANVADIPTKVSDLENDSNFITNIPSEYVTEAELNSSISSKADSINVYTKSEIDKKLSDLSLGSGNIIFSDVADGEIFIIATSSSSEVYGNIVVSKTSISINEGATDTFTVKLDQAPTNNQIVNLSLTSNNCILDKTSLTFTSSNYSNDQEVTVTGKQDSSSYENKTDTITVSSPKVSSKTVSVTIVNTDVEKTLSSITAAYNQGSTVIYPDTSLDNLKPSLTVTAHYSDSTSSTVTGYTLSGALSEGTSTVTVSYRGKTTTFNVTVTARPTLSSISAIYTQGDTVIYPTTSLESLKDNLVVTAHYSDSTTSTISDYVLSGSLAAGTSTITVTYLEKTTTFDVIVSEKVIDSSDGLVVSYSYDSITKDDANYRLTLNDKTGNGYDTTIQANASSYPYISYANYFKGTNPITVTGPNITSIDDKFTIIYNAKTNNATGGYLAGLDSYLMDIKTSSFLVKDGSQLFAQTSANLTDTSNFKQFACSVDITNKIAKLYCNGELVASDTDGGGAKSLTNKLFTCLYASPNIHVKTIKVYNKILNDDEILSDYNSMEV